MEKTNEIILSFKKINQQIPDKTICFGGIATFLYTQKYLGKDFLEPTEDGDFLIEQEAFYQFKNGKEIYDNPRMQLKRMYLNKIQFDIYVEYQNALPVIFSKEIKKIEFIDNISVINLETLINLKLDVLIDRPKSLKNWRDSIKLLLIADQLNIKPQLTKEKLKLIHDVPLDLYQLFDKKITTNGLKIIESKWLHYVKKQSVKKISI